MTKSSTFQLTINDLASNASANIRDLNEVFDYESEFADVFRVLDNLSIDIRQEVIEEIMKSIPKEK